MAFANESKPEKLDRPIAHRLETIDRILSKKEGREKIYTDTVGRYLQDYELRSKKQLRTGLQKIQRYFDLSPFLAFLLVAFPLFFLYFIFFPLC